MGINLVVAVTDDDWFEMLQRHPNLSEVNFWAPSAATFRALQSGEMFLFKLHAPRNGIVGGGIFTYANTMPCFLAWPPLARQMARIHHKRCARVLPVIAGPIPTIVAISRSVAAFLLSLLFRGGQLDSCSAKLVAEHRLLQDL